MHAEWLISNQHFDSDLKRMLKKHDITYIKDKITSRKKRYIYLLEKDTNYRKWFNSRDDDKPINTLNLTSTYYTLKQVIIY